MIDIINVKQVAAILYQDRADYDAVNAELTSIYSKIDFEGEFFPFVETDYYESEMGKDLHRGMISFQKLVHPEQLAASKIKAREFEDGLRENGNRRINVDIGYMDMFKVVLASFKGRSNKIYLADGVWADMIMYFEEGDYKTFVWGFPDFKSGIYNKDLIKIRNLYKSQLRDLKK
ncbi:MAG: DUF4416 family protein [Proteobacteria bacterium]|nr:DUF4416 family protein [Pseudomonadota bacterium]